MNKLHFTQTISNGIAISEEYIKEYLEDCEANEILPTVHDFLDWLENSYFIEDFIDEYHIDYGYDLEAKQFNDFIKSLNND